jgi:hypothetical protein
MAAEYIAPWDKLPANFGEASNVDRRIFLARRMRAGALASRVVLLQMRTDILKDLESVNTEISSITREVITGHLTSAEATPTLESLHSRLAHLTNVRKANEREERLASITVRKNNQLIKRLLPRSGTLEAQEAPSRRQAD